MRSTSRSKCWRTRGSVRAPNGDSISMLIARSNASFARVEMPLLKLALAGLEVSVGRGDQRQNRVDSGGWRPRRRFRCGVRRRRP